MTSFEPETVTDIETCQGFEAQFKQACTFPGCDGAEAKWIASMAHTKKACPGEYYLCDKHKRELIQACEDAINAHPPRCCPRCLRAHGPLAAVYKSPLHTLIRVVGL